MMEEMWCSVKTHSQPFYLFIIIFWGWGTCNKVPKTFKSY